MKDIMTKAEWEQVEPIFGAEIEGHLYYTKAKKRMEKLRKRGFVYPCFQVLEGKPTVVIRGWGLTDRGNIMFCQRCGQQGNYKGIRISERGQGE